MEDAEDERGDEEPDNVNDWHLDKECDDEIDSKEDRGGLKNVEDTAEAATGTGSNDEGPTGRAGNLSVPEEERARERERATEKERKREREKERKRERDK